MLCYYLHDYRVELKFNIEELAETTDGEGQPESEAFTLNMVAAHGVRLQRPGANESRFIKKGNIIRTFLFQKIKDGSEKGRINRQIQQLALAPSSPSNHKGGAGGSKS